MAPPRTHTASQAARVTARRLIRRPGRGNFGVNLHTPLPVQQESATFPGVVFQGLTVAADRCIVSQAAQPRCCAERLFRPLRLNGQVRAPIRGLPVFFLLQALAEACRTLPPVRQAFAQQSALLAAELRQAVEPASSAGTTTSPEEGTWTCGHILLLRRFCSAASLRPVATPPANASFTAAAQARLAPRSWMPTWSPVLPSALLQTWSTASKTPANADGCAAALNSRPARGATEITQTPCPGQPRARRFAFRNAMEQGPEYKGTAYV